MKEDIKNTKQPDANDSNRLGLEERRMLLLLTGPQQRLGYPTEMLSMLNGSLVERYVIPEHDKERLFDVLYPFDCKPCMDSRMLDIHAGRTFTVRDFIVVREGDGNFLVSPFYAEAGGTVLDWMPVSQIGQRKKEKKEEEEENDHRALVKVVVLALRRMC